MGVVPSVGIHGGRSGGAYVHMSENQPVVCPRVSSVYLCWWPVWGVEMLCVCVFVPVLCLCIVCPCCRRSARVCVDFEPSGRPSLPRPPIQGAQVPVLGCPRAGGAELQPEPLPTRPLIEARFMWATPPPLATSL